MESTHTSNRLGVDVNVGSHVQVILGRHRGKIGVVIAINGAVCTIKEDQDHSIKANTTQCVLMV